MKNILINKRIKRHEATCRGSCKHWKGIARKNGFIYVCEINRRDLPGQGRFKIPIWCPIISDYYEKKRNRNKRRKK